MIHSRTRHDPETETGPRRRPPRRGRRALAALLVAGLTPAAGGVRAEVLDAAGNGFTVRLTADVAAPRDAAWKALIGEVGAWWDSDHTFSGEAANLSIDPRPGGCFCERLEGGGVQHLEVVFAEPPEKLVMRGGLGPLLSLGVDGSQSWTLTPTGDGTRLELTYRVGGYVAEGLDGWAPAVDSVLAQQLERYERYVETGSPEPAP